MSWTRGTAVCLLLFATISCSSPRERTITPLAPNTVRVAQSLFTPTTLTVPVGTTVTWLFQDRFPHSVQGIGPNARELNSPIIDNGTWSHTFTAPGEYRYNCQLHPDMTATIVVRN